MWRWSQVVKKTGSVMTVFSTYVEVILLMPACAATLWSFLHVCGGDPVPCESIKKSNEFSPRMWRWSCKFNQLLILLPVFSTYVEVILNQKLQHYQLQWFSPRMWRWSSLGVVKMMKQMVFSTYVEVILSSSGLETIVIGFLHVCGGDPYNNFGTRFETLFSSQKWS